MATLLWHAIMAAVLVLLAVGALAYLLVKLLIARIKNGAVIVSAYDETLSGRSSFRRDLVGYAGLRAVQFTKTVFRKMIFLPLALNRATRESIRHQTSGQALIEFTLLFVLFLAIIWIPADFGLAFYSGQLAQNASREGARLAAATTPFDVPNIQGQVMNRMSSAVLKNVTAGVTPPACDPTLNMQVVTVTVAGEYNFYFYQLVRLLGLSAPDNVVITRTTTMRYEHGFTC